MIEKAKSGRAKCRSCGEKIEKDVLRFGLEVESDFGTSTQWHHVPCAAAAYPQELKTAIDESDVDIPAALLEPATGVKRKSVAFPYAELAPSGRSACRQCDEKIVKDSYRIAFETEIDTGSFTRKGAGYLHPQCAPEALSMDPDDLAEQLEENSTLAEEELSQVLDAMA